MEEDSTIILTSRPDHRPGVFLLKRHYDAVCAFILSRLREKEAIRLEDLIDGIKAISNDEKADLAWVLLHVKSDLEAKKVITVNVIKSTRTQIVNLNVVRKSWWVKDSRNRIPGEAPLSNY
jgi:hypothetical protein